MASGGLFHTSSRHHNCHHVPTTDDCGAAATRCNDVASGDDFHNATTNHIPTTDDCGAAATRCNVVASGNLHNATTNHVPSTDDHGVAATRYNVNVLMACSST